MKKEVHYKDSESYPMLTNLNENQYQEVSNIDPMTKKFHLEKKKTEEIEILNQLRLLLNSIVSIVQ